MNSRRFYGKSLKSLNDWKLNLIIYINYFYISFCPRIEIQHSSIRGWILLRVFECLRIYGKFDFLIKWLQNKLKKVSYAILFDRKEKKKKKAIVFNSSFSVSLQRRVKRRSLSGWNIACRNWCCKLLI